MTEPRTCPIAAMSASPCSIAKAWSFSAAAESGAAAWSSSPATNGRCRKAASTKARRRSRRRGANSSRKPTSPASSLIAEAPDWLSYDLPAEALAGRWKGRYRGQTQKWFAFRFEGEDTEIDIERPGGGAFDPEFDALALGADRDAAGAGGSLQAAGLRGGRRCFGRLARPA